MPRPRVRVEAPVTEADYIALDTALAEAFGGAWAPSPEGAARLRRTAEGGGAVRLARAPDGGCAGGALCSAPAEGTAELAGVGTLSAHRGRGIAAAVTASLAEALFARGARSVRLEYSGQGSRRVYERVGFRPGGSRLYLTLEGSRVTRRSPGNGFSATNRRISSTATAPPSPARHPTRRDARDRSAHPGRNPAGGTARCRRRQTY
ncbi:GNAT family N-acetyltransferase [Streptomyces misionensis]|uniref:GNAT family N-acetyltransferase n=1 Tax=Streptomyces misionensis TaxID=67331 RepID=UPI00396B90CE